eukprot:COSAG02_NODE_5397_length_4363_cov_31.840994_3_plen_459_part_00
MVRERPSFVVEDGWTLGEAVRDINERRVGALLASGASADDERQFFDPGGGYGRCAPLFLAVIWGYERIVAELLEFDADPEWQHPDYGSTALHMAVKAGLLGVTTLLLEKGAEPNSIDRDGCTPLITATLYGHTDCADLLLKNKADASICSDGLGTALKVAEREGYSSALGGLREPFLTLAKMLRQSERRQRVDLPPSATEAQVEAAERIAEGQAAASRDEWSKAIRCYEVAATLTPENDLLPSKRKIEPLQQYAKVHHLKQLYLSQLTSITAAALASCLEDGREALEAKAWHIEHALDLMLHPPEPEPEPEPSAVVQNKKKKKKKKKTKAASGKGKPSKTSKNAKTKGGQGEEQDSETASAPAPFQPFQLPDLSKAVVPTAFERPPLSSAQASTPSDFTVQQATPVEVAADSAQPGVSGGLAAASVPIDDHVEEPTDMPEPDSATAQQPMSSTAVADA